MLLHDTAFQLYFHIKSKVGLWRVTFSINFYDYTVCKKVKNEKFLYNVCVCVCIHIYNLISDSRAPPHIRTFNQKQRKRVSLTSQKGRWVNRWLKKKFNRPYIPMVLKIHKTICRGNSIPLPLLSYIYISILQTNRPIWNIPYHEGNQNYWFLMHPCGVPLRVYK